MSNQMSNQEKRHLIAPIMVQDVLPGMVLWKKSITVKRAGFVVDNSEGYPLIDDAVVYVELKLTEEESQA